ncbi:hypothetical protein BC941DRAFT_445305 [Chlamydoabsidia padenii]|nr:hypothetical protein BC941DRAFT_445305 [Chlamydoabsidia padenii]
MSHPQRTLWFRLFHRSLPTRQKFYKRLPSVFQSPLCFMCSINMDNDYHFLSPENRFLKIIFW